MNGIEIKNVKKKYGSNCALDDISLTFEEHKIYGLLGRNGAGKSTLLNIITNRVVADQGLVYVDGVPAKESDQAQSKIYLMSEKTLYPDKMKIKEIFRWTKEFYPSFDFEYAMKLADMFELDVNKKVKALSTGYTSIFKVIVALAVNVPYVLLDEPVLGLDAYHRDVFYQALIEKYSNEPSTFVLSTHLIEEVSSVIEDIIIIKKGKILKNETREDLLSGGYTVSGMAAHIDQFIAGKNVIGTDHLGGLKTAYILGDLDRTKVPAEVEITKLDLQKLFVQLTNA